MVSLDELRELQKKDPLVAAGWQGILFLSFAAILLLSAIGFLIYCYLTAQKRTLEFAVLRTMGFSRFQIAAVVGFEQCFVIGLGMIAGTLMGLRLGALMINYMGVTETGDSVLPPMALHVSWVTIGSALLVPRRRLPVDDRRRRADVLTSGASPGAADRGNLDA